MDSAGSTIAAPQRRSVEPDDLFDQAGYSEWVRATMRAAPPVQDAAVLFESTISEPTAALVEVIRDAFSGQVTNRYVSAFDGGNHFMIEGVCRRYGVEPDQVIATTGATSAIAMLVKAFVAPGDHVLVERPGFDLLARVSRDAGAVIEDLPRPAPSFRIDPATLRAKLTRRTRLVLITNLHNPSGALLSAEDVRCIAAIADESGALVVLDAVYADFARDATRTPAALGPNVVTVSSLTKVFGLFALKCGWLIADPSQVERVRRAAPDDDLGVSKLSHAVAAHVLDAPDVFDAHWKRILAATRPVMQRWAEGAAEAGLIEGRLPPHGCMFFPRVVGADDTRALARSLWRQFGLLVAPGEYFGMAGHIRIGFGSEGPEFERGLERLRTALEALRMAR